MEFSTPAGTNPADRSRVLGKPTPRIDGPLKVTGTAPYAYERHDVAQGQLVGYPLGAGIATGRISTMDTSRAKAAPGVVSVVTTLDMDALPIPSEHHQVRLFGGDRVDYYHQAIAVVVAETFEQARAAAGLIDVAYEPANDAFDISKAQNRLGDGAVEPEVSVGDFESTFANAPHKLDRIYRTAAQSHAHMEPQASIAAWDGDDLTLWTSSQMIQWAKEAMATALGIDPERVRVDSPFIGGGFGNKLFVRSDAILAALGARAAGRPVKLALPRPFIMNNTTHRAETIQRIRIGVDDDGRILALGHESLSNAVPGGEGEDATLQSPHFYAAKSILTVNRVFETHLPEANAMRAPGEAPGHMGLEMALDEVAEMIGMDPVELRIVNDTKTDPSNGKPFSERHFVECLRRGADTFGWGERNATPGSRRDGDWLIGHGMAGAYRDGPAMTSAARVHLQPDGRVVVETDMTDIGTGSYTIIAQTAAEMLGLSLDQIEVRLGDSAYPISAGSGGQWGAASATAGTYAACVALRDRIAERMGVDPDTVTFEDGSARAGDTVRRLADLAADGEIVATEGMSFGDFRSEHMTATFGAHFVELGVHATTGEIRVRRMLAVCDSGRILNPVTARSQVLGAMVMGLGSALLEHVAVDTGKGLFANHDLASYEVPVHADIPEQEVVFLDTVDPVSSPLKAKGVAELGLCGSAAAVANAFYNATGIRVRSYPITLDKFLQDLPSV
ncbi:MAG: xanthine dehydrogenase family protein molybdopterin-binding subunit [Burkholderiaceae bacterium]